MIDWKAVKRADDAPYVSVSPGKKYKHEDLFFNRRPVAPRVLHPLEEKPVPYDGQWRQPIDVVPGAGKYYDVGDPPVITHVMPRDRIRPLLYNNPQREPYETGKAYANRWQKLLSLARTPKDRASIWKRIGRGETPPIVMDTAMEGGKTYDLDDRFFARPGETVQTTYASPGHRSYSYPFLGNAFISAEKPEQNMNNREEWAHIAAPVVQTRNNWKSAVKGIPGGDLGTLYNAINQPGSYELDPGEMARYMLLQKAAAANLGYPAFRNPNEWYFFQRNNNHPPVDGRPMPVKDRLDYPYAHDSRNGEYRFDNSTYSNSLMKTFDDLRNRLRDPNLDEGTRKAYQRQFDQLYKAIQDAIDMAAARGGREDMHA